LKYTIMEETGETEGNSSSATNGNMTETPSKHCSSLARPRPSLLHLRGTNKRLVMATVGLPGRGKTFLAKKLSRYLNWLSYTTKVFNLGTYRRDMFGEGNTECDEKLNQCRQRALDDIRTFFEEGGHVAIYDGGNTTKQNRDVVRDYVSANLGETHNLFASLVWIEVTVTDPKMVLSNIRELSNSSPDYTAYTEEKVTEDLMSRIEVTEKTYQPLGAKNKNESYIQLLNGGDRVVTNHIHGYLLGKIVFFLMSLRPLKNDIYISRHGESMYNTVGKLGGDSSLSPRGQLYAIELAKHFEDKIIPTFPQKEEFQVWCSTLKRTQETATHFTEESQATHWRALAEIDAGICEDLTPEEVGQEYPDIAAQRKADKLRFRYPQGESYEDVICRLEPVLFELNRCDGPVLVVGHRAVLRCLYAYYLDIPSEEIPHLSVPLHTLIKITPKAYGCDEQRIPLGIPSVDDAVADETGFNQVKDTSNTRKVSIGTEDD